MSPPKSIHLFYHYHSISLDTGQVNIATIMVTIIILKQ